MSGISIVVLTHNRVHLLRQCVANALARTSDATSEIIIWNNASTDGTREFLDSLTDPRLRVVHHPENIGQNGYARAFATTTGDYLVELDDDVIDAPHGWDKTLLDAYTVLPTVGFLAANLVDDPNDTGARTMRERADQYTRVTVNGQNLLKGPVGGACAITSRELHDRVGGFPQQKGTAFYLEDAAYVEKIGRIGYEAAFLEDLRVHHAGGPFYAADSADKKAYWEAYARAARRKDAVKRVLLAVPFVARLNTRYGWFKAPAPALQK
jgi:GT2 family glycosyltransferase